MRKGLSVGILYLSLHNLLTRKFGVNKELSKKEMFCELGKHFLVPKPLKIIVIKEMEDLKLIKRISTGKIKVLYYNLDLRKDFHKILKDVEYKDL